jgi:hypothetical protein
MTTPPRTTQLRALFLQPGGRLRVVWWISDASLHDDEQIAEVQAELADVLVDRRLTLATAERWHRAAADGSSWLVMDADARAWLDPRRDTSRRSTTPEGIS